MKKNLAALLFVSALSQATPLAVIYSNLNPDPRHVFADYQGYTMFENPTRLPFGVYTTDAQLAMPFTTPAIPPYPTAYPGFWGFQLTQIDIAARYDLGYSDAYNVLLYSDSGGRPGPFVTSGVLQHVPGLNHAGFNCCELDTLTFSTRLGLLPGSGYWLALQSVGHDGAGEWLQNTTGVTGTMYQSDAHGVWQPLSGTLAAFDVLGFALEIDGPLPLPDPPSVPEPSTAFLGLAGLAVIAVVARGRAVFR